jgi:7-keto-8-aminopelargonate synthetase-like enzyme
MRTAEERLALLDEMYTSALDERLVLRTADDVELDGRTVSFEGQSMLNFGSCSYLGLELDPRMRQAVVDAVMRYGTQFSSSRTYVQAPPYPEAEALLAEMFGGEVLMVPSTSLGHVAALPVIVGSHDTVVVDQMVHHSVQMAVNHVRVQGSPVEMIRHSSIERLERILERAEPGHRVWYLADGIYSMFSDLAPFAALRDLLDRDERLHLYIDDSHGVGWAGRHGRGPALDALGPHERLVVAASLNKSFAASGAALVFHDSELARKVRLLGGPMIFSGPVQPPMLGAAIASARIHLSDELPRLQAALRERILYCMELLREFCVPLAGTDIAPIRFVPVGLPEPARELAGRLMADGLYTNIATFPAVPMKQSGIRFTLTLHHQQGDIVRLVEALAHHLPAVTGEGPGPTIAVPANGAAARAPGPAAVETPAMRLVHRTSIDELDAAEWDAMLGDRGTFSAAGLRFLEQAFGGASGRAEDRWQFHYYIVRDRAGAPVLASWFTDALWKDDMLSPMAVSELVEDRRREDRYYLTSRTFSMGSLLTEGDHLYLDRSKDWRAALGLLVEAVGEHASAVGAPATVIRDVSAGDSELDETLKSHGFVRINMPDSHVIAPVAPDDATWLAGLSQRSRALQRREVLPREHLFEVELLSSGGRVPTDTELGHLHELYRNVRARSLELNSFELPRTLWRDMLAHDCWELMLVRLRPEHGGDGTPVLFGANFLGARHYAPIIVGLDYDYVNSHGVYRQGIRQVLLRARALGAERILFGMGAPLEKQRFGAEARTQYAYVQSADHYSHEVLATLEAGVNGHRAGRRRATRANYTAAR